MVSAMAGSSSCRAGPYHFARAGETGQAERGALADGTTSRRSTMRRPERRRRDRKDRGAVEPRLARERDGEVQTQAAGLFLVAILSRQQAHAPHEQEARRQEAADGGPHDRPGEFHATKSSKRHAAGFTIAPMSNDPLAALPIGRKVIVSKTVSESDVYLFAGITGDFSPNHTDEAYMRKTRYGRRIAHGALAIGFMSNASTKILEDIEGTWVSYGYDRVRFPAPLFFGDTITVTYEVAERNEAERKVFSRVTVTTDRGSLVAAATHILKRVDV